VDMVEEALVVLAAGVVVVGLEDSAAGVRAVAGRSAVTRKRESRWFRKN
jgi:hypothetical protein